MDEEINGTGTDLESPPPEGEPVSSSVLTIAADDLMTEAGWKIIATQFARMQEKEPGVRVGEEVKAVHDMRVAVRRMRAALSLLRPYYERDTRRALARMLKSTTQALGPVRDLDVLIAHIDSYRAAEGEDRQEFSLLVGHLYQRRERARERMLAYLDGPAYQETLNALFAFCENPVFPDEEAASSDTVSTIAPHLIYEQYAAIRGAVDSEEEMTIEALHALRIKVKAMRYMLEFLQSALGPEADEVIKSLIRMQDHLGALQDAGVARRFLQKYLINMLKQIRREQKHALRPLATPPLEGLTRYLESRDQEIQTIYETFPQFWEEIVSPDFRHKLALAISVL